MTDYQLRFWVPAASASALRAAVESATGQCDEVVLTARYFDTPGADLARQGASLRLRREAGQWIQTLALAAGDGLGSRSEHVPLADGFLDLAALAERPGIAAQLGDASQLRALQDDLSERYQRVFERVRTVVHHDRPAGCVVALAIDAGEYRVGQIQLPAVELTMTLLGGPLDGLLALARLWQARFALVWNPLTAGDLGVNLQTSGALVAATRCVAPRLPTNPSVGQACATLIDYCLLDVARCAASVSEITGNVPETAAARSNRLLRRAARRLHVMTRLGHRWLDGESLPPERDLSVCLQAMGQLKHRQAFYRRLLKQLYDAGCGPLGLSYEVGWDDQGREAAVQVQAPLLALLAWRHSSRFVDNGGHRFHRLLTRRLNQQLRRICRQCRQFDELSAADLHKLKRRLRELQILLSLCDDLLPAKRVKQVRRHVMVLLPMLRTWRHLEHAAHMLDAGAADATPIAGEASAIRRPGEDRASWQFAAGWIAGRMHGLRAGLGSMARQAARVRIRF